MKSYTQSKVNPDIPGIIVMSHGPFAVGLIDTAKMLFGEPENIAAFSLEEGDDIDEYRSMFSKTFESFPKGSIVLADLYGGTPCNQVLQYAQENHQVFELVTGVNLPMLLHVVISRQSPGILEEKDFSLDAVENAKSGISRVDIERFISSDDDDED